jgi:hypothetical protein
MEPSGEADEYLVHCLWHVSFTDASSKLLLFVDSDMRSL